jgi:hypothetical protein
MLDDRSSGAYGPGCRKSRQGTAWAGFAGALLGRGVRVAIPGWRFLRLRRCFAQVAAIESDTGCDGGATQRMGRVWGVRLLPRINLKREAWPGGPQVGEVLEAQLSPTANARSGSGLAGAAVQTPSNDSVAVNLLLLLR